MSFLHSSFSFLATTAGVTVDGSRFHPACAPLWEAYAAPCPSAVTVGGVFYLVHDRSDHPCTMDRFGEAYAVPAGSVWGLDRRDRRFIISPTGEVLLTLDFAGMTRQRRRVVLARLRALVEEFETLSRWRGTLYFVGPVHGCIGEGCSWCHRWHQEALEADAGYHARQMEILSTLGVAGPVWGHRS